MSSFKINPLVNRLLVLTSLVIFSSCSRATNDISLKTAQILLTSAAGDKLAYQENVDFIQGEADGLVIEVYPDEEKQVIDGIGSSFTESSAFVLAHLSKSQRADVMSNIYSTEGANFSLTRTHIGSCDFSVEGKYSYNDTPDDRYLENFSIEADKMGFSEQKYPYIVDEKYDLLPMIKEAKAIKEANNEELRIIASAWTAPFWMKDINDWYIPGAPDNNWQGTGGSLKAKYVQTYANYLVKYLNHYKHEGVDIWGLTPVNEPHGNNGQWESMKFTPESQNDFIKHNLGPALTKQYGLPINLLIYDQNRDGLEEWTDTIYGDEESSKYVYGAAIHWYESTYKVFEDVLERVHQKYPSYKTIHTEGCIDDLGKDAPTGVKDPGRFKETDWFKNDDFWWNDNATDWAYTVPWQGVKVEDHPIYTPVHRYARNIIVSLDHWVTGWVDWNVVLDSKGGPNHVGNFCGAPIMIDTESKDIYYTPIFHILSQFSRTIRPGDIAIRKEIQNNNLDEDALHVCASKNADKLVSVQLLNTTRKEINYKLKIGDKYADIVVPANSLQTVRVQL
jgi:glucosylceramidase